MFALDVYHRSQKQSTHRDNLLKTTKETPGGSLLTVPLRPTFLLKTEKLHLGAVITFIVLENDILV